jgi:AcrR family transcriptional regulator
MAGLRELKKARTRASIREHALRLFNEQGYVATTVEQIAEAAEVSPSTFFRYYPTKEDVLLRDDFEVRMFEAFERQPADLAPFAAVRAAVREAVSSLTEADWDDMRQQAAIAMEVPEVRARTIDELTRAVTGIADALGRRAGLPPDDLRVRTLAGVVIGIITAVGMPYEKWTKGGDGSKVFDDAFALLEQGLPLSLEHVVAGVVALGNGRLGRDRAEPPGLEVLEGLHQLGAGVHHERPVGGDRFLDRLAAEQQDVQPF